MCLVPSPRYGRILRSDAEGQTAIFPMALPPYLIRRAAECAKITYDQIVAGAMDSGTAGNQRFPVPVAGHALAGWGDWPDTVRAPPRGALLGSVPAPVLAESFLWRKTLVAAPLLHHDHTSIFRAIRWLGVCFQVGLYRRLIVTHIRPPHVMHRHVTPERYHSGANIPRWMLFPREGSFWYI